MVKLLVTNIFLPAERHEISLYLKLGTNCIKIFYYRTILIFFNPFKLVTEEMYRIIFIGSSLQKIINFYARHGSYDLHL